MIKESCDFMCRSSSQCAANMTRLLTIRIVRVEILMFSIHHLTSRNHWCYFMTGSCSPSITLLSLLTSGIMRDRVIKRSKNFMRGRP